MNRTLRISLLAAALLVAGSSLSAQTARPERPYRGLFASGVDNAGQLLALNVSLGAGYDDNVFAEEGLSPDPRAAKAGSFGSVSANLAYSFNTPRLTVGLSAGTTARYLPNSEFADSFYASYGGGAGMSVNLWSGARLSASHSVGYSPYFVLGRFLPLDGVAQPIIQGPEFAAVGDENVSHNTSVGLSQQVSQRGSFGVSYDQQTTHFSGTRGDFASRGGGARYTHNVAKGLGLRVGYGYRESDRQEAVSSEDVRVHTIDAGVDFNRALSVSRRTVLSFGTGSSAVTDASHTSYHITGSASLRHEIGRTWSAALGYDRSVQFVDVLSESFLSDAASFMFGGMVSRRLSFQSRAGVSFAHPTTSGRGGDFDTYLTSVGVSYGITRYVAVGVDYSYYRYQFEAGTVLPLGFSQRMDRQGVRAHVSLWAPLVHRARRPDAAR